MGPLADSCDDPAGVLVIRASPGLYASGCWSALGIGSVGAAWQFGGNWEFPPVCPRNRSNWFSKFNGPEYSSLLEICLILERERGARIDLVWPCLVSRGSDEYSSLRIIHSFFFLLVWAGWRVWVMLAILLSVLRLFCKRIYSLWVAKSTFLGVPDHQVPCLAECPVVCGFG